MAGYSYDSTNLEGCQRVVGSQAGQFGGISDTLSASPVSSDFGSLPESAQLAKIAADVNDTMRSQLASAQKFLQGTEVALDQVLEKYLGADQYAVFMASETTHLPAYQLRAALGE